MDVRFLGGWIREIRAWLDTIEHHGCLPSLLEFATRFRKASGAPLNMAYGRDTIYIDMLVAKGITNLPAKHEHIIDKIEQLTFCRYNARLHWGKNPEMCVPQPSLPGQTEISGI